MNTELNVAGLRQLVDQKRRSRAVRGGIVEVKDDQVKPKLTVSDLHSFRRVFATEMLRVGVDVETVRQWGGWKTLETMLRYLADVRAGDSIKVMNEAAAKLAAS